MRWNALTLATLALAAVVPLACADAPEQSPLPDLSETVSSASPTPADGGAPTTTAILASPTATTASEGPTGGGSSPETLGDPPGTDLALIASGLTRPVLATNAGDGSGRLFVVEKRGIIRVVADGELIEDPFLDIRDRVDSGANERGLLGLAFDPAFRDTWTFFTSYTAPGGRVVLSAFEAAGGRQGDPATERILLEIEHPRSNHNGGMLAFGPDGYLYFGTGDGGGAGDPDRAGQDLSSPAGKILRLDVRGALEGRVAAPPDNPFVDRPGARPEIWAYGLRNPWRFSFDRRTGDLWIGDVGQDSVEEIDLQPAGSLGGENYGWSMVEGDRCFRPSQGCSRDGLEAPLYTYDHDHGCSVTGGYVYRGSTIPDLAGFYLFADYCGSELRTLARDPDGTVRLDVIGETPGTIASFGEDEAGELYLVSDEGGSVHRIIAIR